MGFSLGDAANYAVIAFDPKSFQYNNPAVITGNVGIGNGGSGNVSLQFNTTLNGNLTLQQSSAAGATGHVSGTITTSSSQIASDISSLDTLSSTLNSEAGTTISTLVNTTINASAGVLDGSGNRVFTYTPSGNFNINGVTINGSASDYVVVNIDPTANNANTDIGNVTLTGGITINHVIFNVVIPGTLRQWQSRNDRRYQCQL